MGSHMGIGRWGVNVCHVWWDSVLCVHKMQRKGGEGRQAQNRQAGRKAGRWLQVWQGPHCTARRCVVGMAGENRQAGRQGGRQNRTVQVGRW